VWSLDQAALVVFADVGDAGATCDIVRCSQDGYITCKNYDNHKEKLDGCACVCAPEDGKCCVLHRNDGTSQKCTKTELLNPIT
jgi:hypothetical protein